MKSHLNGDFYYFKAVNSLTLNSLLQVGREGAFSHDNDSLGPAERHSTNPCGNAGSSRLHKEHAGVCFKIRHVLFLPSLVRALFDLGGTLWGGENWED